MVTKLSAGSTAGPEIGSPERCRRHLPGDRTGSESVVVAAPHPGPSRASPGVVTPGARATPGADERCATRNAATSRRDGTPAVPIASSQTRPPGRGRWRHLRERGRTLDRRRWHLSERYVT